MESVTATRHAAPRGIHRGFSEAWATSQVRAAGGDGRDSGLAHRTSRSSTLFAVAVDLDDGVFDVDPHVVADPDEQRHARCGPGQ